jgi:phospholipid-binding lipoprotein MlaA
MISVSNNRKARAAIGRVDRINPVLLLALLFLGLLAALPLTSYADQDPLIEVNRSVHGFNRAMDSAILKPLAETYTTVTPGFVKRRVTSFFDNIDDVRVTINDLLQLKFKQAAGDAGRLVFNTTMGLGGLFDVAEPVLGLEKHHEDFGQTLGYWTVSSGPYIELPLLGPSTVRDSAGLLVDGLLNPLQFLQSGQRTTLVAGEGVTDRAALLEVEGLISGDDYVFIREVYLQRRQFLVHDGLVEDSFGDFDSNFDEQEFEIPMALVGE